MLLFKRGNFSLDAIIGSAITFVAIIIALSLSNTCFQIENRNNKLSRAYEEIQNHVMELYSEDDLSLLDGKEEQLSKLVTARYTVGETEYGTMRLEITYQVNTGTNMNFKYTYFVERGMEQ